MRRRCLEVLVVGRSGVHLVHVDDLGSEVGWSLPREHGRSAKARSGPRSGRTGRTSMHISDGSWAGVRVAGEVRPQLLSQLPPGDGS